jgi:hypothetical protein
MGALLVQVTANGLPSQLNLYFSVTRPDGSPVGGLTGDAVVVLLSHSAIGNGTPVPTTFDMPEVDENGDPILDDNGNQVIDHISLVMPVGLSGIYGLFVNPGPATGFFPNSGVPYALQVRVSVGGDVGQAVVAAV